MKIQEVLLFLQFIVLCTYGVLNVPLKEVKDWIMMENNLDYAIHVNTASVVIADYELIRNKFEFSCNFTNGQIDRWLLKHFAYIATGQLTAGVKYQE